MSKVKISVCSNCGHFNPDGMTLEKVLEIANKLTELKDYYKAVTFYDALTTHDPEDYQGWMGLLICDTQNFTIPGYNAERYYEAFIKTAPVNVSEEYEDKMKEYMMKIHPKLDTSYMDKDSVVYWIPIIINVIGIFMMANFGGDFDLYEVNLFDYIAVVFYVVALVTTFFIVPKNRGLLYAGSIIMSGFMIFITISFIIQSFITR